MAPAVPTALFRSFAGSRKSKPSKEGEAKPKLFFVANSRVNDSIARTMNTTCAFKDGGVVHFVIGFCDFFCLSSSFLLSSAAHSTRCLDSCRRCRTCVSDVSSDASEWRRASSSEQRAANRSPTPLRRFRIAPLHPIRRQCRVQVSHGRQSQLQRHLLLNQLLQSMRVQTMTAQLQQPWRQHRRRQRPAASCGCSVTRLDSRVAMHTRTLPCVRSSFALRSCACRCCRHSRRHTRRWTAPVQLEQERPLPSRRPLRQRLIRRVHERHSVWTRTRRTSSRLREANPIDAISAHDDGRDPPPRLLLARQLLRWSMQVPSPLCCSTPPLPF